MPDVTPHPDFVRFLEEAARLLGVAVPQICYSDSDLCFHADFLNMPGFSVEFAEATETSFKRKVFHFVARFWTGSSSQERDVTTVEKVRLLVAAFRSRLSDGMVLGLTTNVQGVEELLHVLGLNS